MPDIKQTIEFNVQGTSELHEAAESINTIAQALDNIKGKVVGADIGKGLDGAGRGGREAGEGFDRAGKAAEEAKSRISNMRYALYDVAAVMQNISKTAFGAFSTVVKESMEYESAFAQVKRTNDIAEREVIILDPMLATGGSVIATIDLLKNAGCTSIKVLVLVAAPEGIAALEKAHPDVELYTASIDQGLNEHGYIIPGLGDAGDKIFGTK